MMRVYLEGIGLCGPGLPGWQDSANILAGRAEYQPIPTIIPLPTLLPANERRRTVPTVRLALAVGAEAFEHAGRDPADTATVFTSSGGDGETMHAILEVLAADAREVSPTRFHNSVHNAPSAIGPSLSDASFQHESLRLRCQLRRGIDGRRRTGDSGQLRRRGDRL